MRPALDASLLPEGSSEGPCSGTFRGRTRASIEHSAEHGETTQSARERARNLDSRLQGTRLQRHSANGILAMRLADIGDSGCASWGNERRECRVRIERTLPLDTRPATVRRGCRSLRPTCPRKSRRGSPRLFRYVERGRPRRRRHRVSRFPRAAPQAQGAAGARVGGGRCPLQMRRSFSKSSSIAWAVSPERAESRPAWALSTRSTNT